MNNAEDAIRQLLADVPFDDAYRREHRDEVRERALLVFDEAAADRISTTLSVDYASPGRVTRRRVVRLGLAAAIAASLVGVLAAWYGRSDRMTPTRISPTDRAVAQDEAIARANREFVASLNRLNEFEDDQFAAAFDLGVEVCLGEHYEQLARASENSLGTRVQPN